MYDTKKKEHDQLSVAWPGWDAWNKKRQLRVSTQPLREDGKKVCHQLRQLRKQFCEANHITISLAACQHAGRCTGTCNSDDQELAYINSRIKKSRNIVYPKVHIEKGAHL
jgi:hypothetical protein